MTIVLIGCQQQLLGTIIPFERFECSVTFGVGEAVVARHIRGVGVLDIETMACMCLWAEHYFLQYIYLRIARIFLQKRIFIVHQGIFAVDVGSIKISFSIELVIKRIFVFATFQITKFRVAHRCKRAPPLLGNGKVAAKSTFLIHAAVAHQTFAFDEHFACFVAKSRIFGV